jgi:hypothetical protein
VIFRRNFKIGAGSFPASVSGPGLRSWQQWVARLGSQLPARPVPPAGSTAVAAGSTEEATGVVPGSIDPAAAAG